MSLISVVIPVHNTAKYLRKCIDSVLAQTLHDMEVILVENCSTDGSYELCDELAATDSRIRVLHIEIADLATARNRGVAAATSEYVGFIDSDDYIAPGMYEALYENASKYDADLCFCNFSYDREGQIIPYSEETGEKEEETLFEENEQALISKAFVFDSIPVKDVFTKREDISYIEGKSLSIAKVNALLLSSPYSRFPVMGEDGECIGILSSNVYFQEYNKDEHLSILSTLLPPVYVDEEETLDDCFDILNNEQTHMALVKNKEGAITGLVTMDDILSELVGHLDEIPPKRRGKAL